MVARAPIAALLALGLLTWLVSSPVHATDKVTVEARQIPEFRLGQANQPIGKLQFVGGLSLASDNWLFGALSSIRFRSDGQHFVMVLDTGHFLTGEITRDAKGLLSGLANVEITSMRDRYGRDDAQKYNMDSESLAFSGDDVLVSFEGLHRVDVYPGPDFVHQVPSATVPILMDRKKLKGNGSLESLAAAPASSPLGAVPVTIAERSFDAAGNLLAAILDGPLKGPFSVRVTDGYAVSDITFLDNGDLILLERRFGITVGIGLRIVRVPASELKPGAVVEGALLMEAGLESQIDNMEGIDAVTMPDGSTRLILVSDDNHSLLQRSLMLEFRLID